MIQYTIERLSSCVSNYCHTCEFVENWFSLNDSSVTRAKIQKISGRTQPQSEMLAVLSYVEWQDVAIFCVFRMRLCWKHFKFLVAVTLHGPYISNYNSHTMEMVQLVEVVVMRRF